MDMSISIEHIVQQAPARDHTYNGEVSMGYTVLC